MKGIPYLPITPFDAPNPKPQLPLLRTHNRSLDLRNHSPIMQQRGKTILKATGVVLSLAAHEPRHSFREPECDDDLIDEMGTQVVDCTAARDVGFGFPAAGGGGRESGAVAVEVGFEGGDAAEGVGAEKGEEGLEVGIVAAV